MKRFNVIVKIAVLLAVCAVVVSCGGKKSSLNEFGFYTDYSQALSVASKSNKNVLAVFTCAGDDDLSEDFIAGALSGMAVSEALKNDYVCAFLDFGNDTFAETEVPSGATDKEQATAENKLKILMQNIRAATVLGVNVTPAVYLVTKEGYFISYIPFETDFNNANNFVSAVEAQKGEAEKIKGMIAETKKGTAIEKANAIKAIFDVTPEDALASYGELFRSIAKVDKKNESGFVSPVYFEGAVAEATIYFSDGDYATAVKIFEDAASSGYLDPAEKFSAYYMAGYLLGSSDSPEPQRMISLFQNAIAADPSNQDADGVRELIEYVTSMMTYADGLTGE